MTSRLIHLSSSRHLWSVLGGLLIAGAFPKLGWAGLAWVGPGVLLFSAFGKREAFRIGYVGGLAYYLASLYWLLWIPFPAGAIAGWIALGAFLALYPATWVWFCWKTFPRVERFLSVPLPRRILWSLGCAVVWVTLEMIVARLFTGFPWNLLGVSQYQILPLIQMAQYTGVYGLSFLIAWFSVSLAGACLHLVSEPANSKAWIGDLLLPLLVLAGLLAWGSRQLTQAAPPERTLRAVLVQPSIPQTLIWDTNQNAIRFSQLIDLSERALSQTTNAQILIWPEGSVPNMLRYDFDTYAAVTNLALKHHVWVILGSDDAVRQPGAEEREFDYYNSSFLLSPQGEIAGTYRKRRLVIFGEYIPLERWLPFMKYLTPVGGSFTRGGKPRPFVIPELHTKISVLICFEDVFPQLARLDVQPDTDFLLNLTNNGWFGESAAQWQHAANSIFRAVENRIPLVRCANNGLTCWVDRYGGMHDVYFPGTRDIYGAGFKAVDVPLLAPGQVRTLTFYTRHGDWFGWTCVASTGLMALYRGVGSLRAKRARPPASEAASM
jgi:apolipoprotein N-acyltransferase